MDITRNQWFMAGLVLLMLGLQLRMVYSYTLTPEFTKILAERSGHPMAAAADSTDTLLGAETKFASKTFQPPEWIGWALLSLGAVLVLHSLAMPRPG